jgi:rsbT co-antagonist protein RsbR
MPTDPQSQPDATSPDRAKVLLNAITENLELIVWEIDREGVFTYHSGKGLEVVGLKEGEFIGKNVFEIYANHVGQEPVRRALTKGERSHFMDETHGTCWETWLVPVRNDQGEMRGVVGITVNVTVARRAQTELLARLDLIERQKEAIQALSIPIIQVWDSVLTVPLVGMVDSMRAAGLMEQLLNEVVRTRARYAILDLTGVEAMDTSTASHMLRLISSLRLLGAQGILTGIRPSIAHTMVGLGIEMGGVRTLANLRDGLRFCMEEMSEGDDEGDDDDEGEGEGQSDV